MQKLPPEFYMSGDVVEAAKLLLGKLLVTRWEGVLTSGRIVEAEAYNGAADRASHSYNNRRTARTEVQYSKGGKAYVYLCYGIHHLFNVTFAPAGHPLVVLIRAIEPVGGIETMLARAGKSSAGNRLGRGPGNVTRVLGIQVAHNGVSLQRGISIYDDGYALPAEMIGVSPRIGVDYAGEDALLPYRFYVKGNGSVSGPSKWRK
ncbi:MAG: DNA-3-methyladenine glycosylase [Flavihumibacter sp.]